MITPRLLVLCLFLQLLALEINSNKYNEETIKEISIVVKDMNNDEVTRLKTTKNPGSLNSSFVINHAYSYTAVSNVANANWKWTMYPGTVLSRSSKCFHHYQSRANRLITIHISNSFSKFFTLLYVNFKNATAFHSKFSDHAFAESIAFFNDGPKPAGETVNFLAFWFTSSYIMMFQSRSIILSAIIKPSLEHPAPYLLWKSFPQRLVKHCNESSVRKPLDYVKKWETKKFSEVVSWIVDQEKFPYYCVVEFSYTFEYPSFNVVDLTAEYEEISVLVETKVCMVDGTLCPPPQVHIQHGYNSTFFSPFDAPQLLYVTNEEIGLTAYVTGDECLDASNKVEMSWHVVPLALYSNLHAPASRKFLNGIGRRKLHNDKFSNPMINSHSLQYPPYSFKNGEYVVVCSITVENFCGPSSLFTADYVNLKVIYPLLRPRIEGRKLQLWEVVPSTPKYLVLDASKSFSLNHPTDVIKLVWFCHRPYQTLLFKVYLQSAEYKLLKGSTPNYQSTSGCFGSAFVLQNSSTMIVTNQSLQISKREFIRKNGIFVFTILAVRVLTQESAVDDQVVKVISSGPMGRARIIRVYGEVICLNNCEDSLFADEPLTLSVNCKVCGKTSMAIFPHLKPRWYLHKPGDKPGAKKIGHPSITYNGLYGTINVKPTDLENIGKYTLTVEYDSTEFFIIHIAPNQYTFRIPERPTPGYCRVVPSGGVALVTKFKLDCINLKIPGETFHAYTVIAVKKRIYEFGLRRTRPNLPDKYEATILNTTVEPLPDLHFPVGNRKSGFRLKVRIVVTNRFRDWALTTAEVTVVPPNVKDGDEVLRQLLSALALLLIYTTCWLHSMHHKATVKPIELKCFDQKNFYNSYHIAAVESLNNGSSMRVPKFYSSTVLQRIRIENDQVYCGAESKLSEAIRANNVFEATGIVSSATSIIAENPDGYSSVAMTTEMIGKITNLMPRADLNAASQLIDTVAQVSEIWTKKTKLVGRDDINRMVEAVKTMLRASQYSLRRILPTSDVVKYENKVEKASINALRIITNAVKFVSVLRSEGTVTNQNDLMEDREDFLGVLAQIGDKEKTKTFTVGDYEILEILRVPVVGKNEKKPISFEVGLSGNEGGGVVERNDSNNVPSLVAVSTFYFNPFPPTLGGVVSSEVSIDAPVIGVSLIDDQSLVSFDATGENEQNRPAPPRRLLMTCSMLFPLKNVKEKSESFLKTTSVASIHLPPPCSNEEPPSNPTEPTFVGEDEVQGTCGPIQLEVDIASALSEINNKKRSLLSNILGVEQKVAYLVLKPSGKCRFFVKPCLRVSFAKSDNTSTCDSNAQSDCRKGFKVLYSITLPRTVSTAFGESFQDDAWSIPLTKTVLQAIKTKNQSTIALVEDLQADPLAESRTGTDKFRQVGVNLIKADCFAWGESSLTWSKQLCGRGKLVNGDKFNCECNLPTANDKTTKSKKPPFLLGGSVIAIPNYINFDDALSLLFKLQSNPYIALTIIAVWIMFIPFLLWAERRDREEAMKPPIIIPEDSIPTHSNMYEVVIFTSIYNNSGTTANVTIVLEGVTGERSLPHVISDEGKTTLQRGSIDTYIITTEKPLGRVITVKLWHDNAGSSPSWCLDRLAVYDMQSSLDSTNSYFIVDTWLSVDFFPFLCHAEIHVSTSLDLASTKNLWRKNLFYQFQNENIWTSMFNKTTGSSFTRIQRVGCCMVTVFGCMLATMMFYELSDDLAFQLTLGQVSLSYASLIIGTEAALLMAPVNFLVDYSFRNLEPPDISPRSVANLAISKTKERLHSLFEHEASSNTSKLVLNPSGVGHPKPLIKSRNQKYYSVENLKEIHRCNWDIGKNRDSDCSFDCDISESDIESSDDETWSESEVVLSFGDTETSGDDTDRFFNPRPLKEKLSNSPFVASSSFKMFSGTGNREKTSTDLTSTSLPRDMQEGVIEKADDETVTVMNPESLRFRPYSQFKMNSDHVTRKLCPITPLSTAGRGDNYQKVKENDSFESNEAPSLFAEESGTSMGNSSLYKDSLSKLPEIEPSETVSLGPRIRPETSEDFKHYLAVPGCYFPRWFYWIAWFAVVCHLLCCSFFTLLYGLQFGKEKFLDWLLTFISSMVQNMLIITPVRLFGIAAFETYACVSKFSLNDWVGVRGTLVREDAVISWKEVQQDHKRAAAADEEFVFARDSTYFDAPSRIINWGLLTRRAQEVQKRPWCYRYPRFSQLVKAGKLNVAIEQVKRFWVGVVCWILMAIVVTTILLLQRDARLPRLRERFRQNFVSDFMEIQKPDGFLDYLEYSFVPTIFQESEISKDDTFTLLGAVRLRQIRIKPIDCSSAIPQRLQKNRCLLPDYDINFFSEYDTGSYRPFWRLSAFEQAEFQHDLNENENEANAIPNPWQYTYLTQTDRPLPGNALRRSYYPSGGFVVDLRYEKEDMVAVIRGMRSTWWITNGTAAVFIDFTLYSKYSHFVTSIFLSFEMLSEGNVNLFYEINSYKPPYLYSILDIVLVMFQLCHIVLNVGLAVDLVHQCRDAKWQIGPTFKVLFNIWNFLSICIIILNLVAYFTFFIYVVISIQALNKYKNDTDSFTAFSIPARFERTYMIVLSFSAFFSYMQLLKVFRSSKIVTLMMDTLFHAKKELFNISLTIVVFIFAFAHASNIAFGANKEIFRTFASSCIGLYNLIGGHDIEHDPGSVPYNPLWSFLYVCFLLLNVILFANLYAVVCDENYTKMREFHKERVWDPVEILAILWLYEKLLMLGGITTSGYSRKYLQDKPRAIEATSNITLHSVGGQDLRDKTGHHGHSALIKRKPSVRIKRPSMLDRAQSSLRHENQRLSIKSVYFDS